MVIRILCSLLLTAPAWARHTDETRITDYSAYTQGQWEWRVGPFRSAVGLGYGIEVGVYPLLTLLKANNLQIKWTAWERGPWAVALRTGIFQLDTADFQDEPPEDGSKPLVFKAFPFELIGTWRAERSSINLGISGTLVEAEGKVQGEFDLDGAGAFNTVLLQGAWEWRWTTTTAIVIEGRLKLSEKLTANGSFRTDLDEDSYIEVFGNGNSTIEGGKGSLSVSGYWSYDNFNLRLGVGYGHYTAPVANIFLPFVPYFSEPNLFPELAMYWRF